ncbi:hypothetical protein [Accumulibacter sp.]|uniref:hypothetical protein n=1 Tax=Accumulibacter sp. TaxID=2053492 RepID=UPI002635421D|nr:hypothetical protein [Accumulibacter sp.]
MPLTLVVPELLWPEPGDRQTLESLDCPGLCTLLARSRLGRRPPQSFEAALCEPFGLTGELPYAAYRVLGESGMTAAREACWICADPVHLRLHQERLVLADGGSLAIDSAEAEAIVGELNRQFSDIGTFHVATAERWYLQFAGAPDLGQFDVLPLSTVAGRRVERQLPETPRLRWLRQLLNEIQMLLHRHPANIKREEEGRSTINSLWLWGAGALPATAASSLAGVWADDPLALGLGRAFGLPAHPLPDDAGQCLSRCASASRQLLVVDALQRAVHYEDADAWRAALLDLEARWFAPLQKALAGGRIGRLCLQATTAYGTLAWESGRSEQWKLWRRPEPLISHVQSLARAKR